ncbi:MAG: phosphatidylglycerophosphatase A [Ignavibacteria bacterium]|jgi:phosphatidylglycerophosphatase A|nr:phosphatidylglycerophosphatase A [Ignavibacteria bacterium]
MNKINFIERAIGSGLFTGYVQKGSGTLASGVAVLIYLIPGFEQPAFLILLISLLIVFGVPIANKFETTYGKDPSQCTIDEFVGTWISLLFIPKKIWWILVAFIIWRVLDIFKPYPIKKLESIKGGWGIMLDDVVAGFLAFFFVHLIIFAANLLIN